jgi:N utilization substance protein A
MRGVRIQSIVNELGGEKIDIIEWSPETSIFIAKSLSPAKVLSVQLEDDPIEGKTASVVVPDGQLSLAIGRAGQNARLAAKLTGWRIDIQSVTEAATWALQQVNENPDVLPSLGLVAELLPSVANILRRYEKERLPYSSEELRTLRQVIEGVRGYYALLRDAERARLVAEETARRAALETAEAERRVVIEAALARIPPQAHDIPLTEIDLSTRVLGHLERADLATVGDVMTHMAEGDEGLLKLDGIGPKSLAEVKHCIKALTLPEVEEAAPTEEAVAEVEVEAEAEIEAKAALPVEPAPEAPAKVTKVAPEVQAPEAIEEAPAEEAVSEEVPVVAEIPEPIFEEEEEEEIEIGPEDREKRERDRRRRRELVYDEDLGVLVARRRRKRDDDLDEWEKYLR